MKKIQISLAATCLAALVVAMPRVASASDGQGLDSTSTSAGKDRLLLAQVQTARTKKKSEKSKDNVDQTGAILHGKDAVDYIKQNRPLHGNIASYITLQVAHN